MLAVGRLCAAGLAYIALSTFNSQLSSFGTLALIAPFGILAVVAIAVLPTTDQREVLSGRLRSNAGWRSLPLRALSLPVLATVSEVGLLGLVTRLLPLFEEGRPGFASGPSLIVMMVCGTIAGGGLPFVLRATRHAGMPWAAIISALSSISGIAVLFPIGATAALACVFLYGAMVSGMTALIWARVAEIVTRHAEQTGVRFDAIAFALITTAIKLSIALSNALLGIVVDGFRTASGWSTIMIVVVMIAGGVGNWAIFARADWNTASSGARR